MTPAEIKSIIGKNIQKLRKNAQLTQKQFARLIKGTTGNIWKYESGSNSFPLDKLPIILKTLRCTAEELFFPLLYLETKDLGLMEVIQTVKMLYRQPGGPEELERVLRYAAREIAEREEGRAEGRGSH